MHFLKVHVPKTVVCVGAEDQLNTWGFSEVQRQSGSSTLHRLSQAVAKKTPDLSGLRNQPDLHLGVFFLTLCIILGSGMCLNGML